MKKKICLILSAVLLCTSVLTACSSDIAGENPPTAEATATADPAATEAAADPTVDPAVSEAPAEALDRAVLDETAAAFISLLLENKYDDCFAMFDEILSTEVTATMLKNEWEAITREAGAFQNTGKTTTVDSGDGHLIYDISNDFKDEGVVTRVVINQTTAQVAMVYFTFTSKTVQSDADDLPAGVSEMNLTVSEGTATALNAKLTYPTERAGAVPAVVLVHGSGRNGMDEVIGVNKFFRQLAYGLAERGIAVLRYDKRTYAYNEIQITTINEEIIDDATAARATLLSQQDVALSGVYVVGHNFGAMLTPRIAEEAHYDGMVLMAGSPRNFAEVLFDQYTTDISLQDMTEGDIQANLELVQAEYDNAMNVMSLSEEELMTMTYFGMPADYFKSIAAYPTSGYLETLAKPALILQGDKDAQTSVEKDFNGYAAYAESNQNIETKLYPGLNNLFMTSTIEPPSTEAYLVEGNIDPIVIDDVAAWLKAR